MVNVLRGYANADWKKQVDTNAVFWLDRAQHRWLCRRYGPTREPDRLPLRVSALIIVLASLGLWAAVWWVVTSVAAALW